MKKCCRNCCFYDNTIKICLLYSISEVFEEKEPDDTCENFMKKEKEE